MRLRLPARNALVSGFVRYLLIGAGAAIATGFAALVGYSLQQFYLVAIHPLS